MNSLNLTSREGELRHAINQQIDNYDLKAINDVLVCETDNGILAQVVSSNHSYDKMVARMADVARGLVEEGDNVHILFIQSYADSDRVAKLDVSNSDFADMSECEQRLRVAHNLRLQ
jgi:hypothetical protein